MPVILSSTAIVATADASPAHGGRRDVVITDGEIGWTEQGRVVGFKVHVKDARNNTIGGQYPIFCPTREGAFSTAREAWVALRSMCDTHPDVWCRA